MRLAASSRIMSSETCFRNPSFYAEKRLDTSDQLITFQNAVQ